ncbi:hypothetical protein Hdeb2414_s0002g00049051 [Helianthus debilis subsp. tardiflorus]
MSDVWMGSYKLFFALARFVDGEKIDWKGGKRWVPLKKADDVPVQGNVDKGKDPIVDNTYVGNGLGDGRSFKDSLLNVALIVEKKRREIVVDSKVKGSLLWLGCGVVERVSDLNKLSKLREWLNLGGHNGVGIRYVGGLWVVLVFNSEECMEEFVLNSEVWKEYFDSVDKWVGQAIPRERVVWLKLFGLPLGLFDNGFINEIGALYGKVIQPAEVSEAEVDLSFATLGVLCEPGTRINETVDIVWNKEVFSILVEEELGEWVPDCLEDSYEDAEDEGVDCDGRSVEVEEGLDNNMEEGDMAVDNVGIGEESDPDGNGSRGRMRWSRMFT